MSENQGGTRWWKKLLGKKPPLSPGEIARVAPGSNTSNYQASQERMDAMRLIQIGNETGDQQTKRIGQARLRMLEGKETLDDLELLEK